MQLEKDYSIKEFNTMGFDIIAKYYCRIDKIEDLKELIDNKIFKENKKIFLGGGSNILFTNEYYDGIIIHSNIKGVDIIQESDDENSVVIRCMAGEVWKDFVDYTVRNGFHGLENLADIPGSVGACPVQNIGAYGVEVKDCIRYVHAIDITDGSCHSFENKDCCFSYRNSIFKKEENKKYFIYAVDFELKKHSDLKLEYGNIKEHLDKVGISEPSISELATAIKEIRSEKLPEVGVVGSVGSFFQNPIVSESIFKKIKENHSEVPSYPNENGIKIPAGWLIERAGWKGYKENHVGVWDKQALVLVHYGGGNSKEILVLMKKIQESIKEKFGIEINAEVNIV